MNAFTSTVGRFAILAVASVLIGGSVAVPPASSRAPLQAAVPRDRTGAFTTALPAPAALTDAGLGLRSGPVAVPIELRAPTIGLSTPVLGVGITPGNVMDAPMGPAQDPVWQEAFWYRGSAVPGAASVALIAGHISDPLGRAGVFARLTDLRPGDPIIVHDERGGPDMQFAVSDATSYPLAATTDPMVLTEIYGAGPVAGRWAEPSADGRSYLTLITCDGTFRDGTHDHRLVVHATRVA